MGQNNIIELNGKQYDALTGALLGESKIKATPRSRTARMQMRRQGRTIDGFIRKESTPLELPAMIVKPSAMPKVITDNSATHVTAKLSNAVKGKQSMSDIKKASHKADTSRAVRALQPHQPEKPKTLMRRVVHKPKMQMKPSIKTAAPAEMMARPASSLVHPLEKKLSVTQTNPVRLGRARQIPKSQHIRRFSTVHNRQNIPLAANTSATAKVVAGPAARPQQYATQPIRQHYATTLQTSSHVTRPLQERPVEKPDASDIFEAALARATSHEQKAPLRYTAKRKRLVNAFAGLFAVLLVAGFLGYLNKPGIEVRVASMRAGFHAQMPTYTPTGYAMIGGVQSSKGKVTMRFSSGDSAYLVTQEASDWNSATLLDQTAEDRGAPTRTVQNKGRIIYIYNNTSAVWVNGGVRYEIASKNSLGADQLVALATSL